MVDTKKDQETLFPDYEQINTNTEFVTWVKEDEFIEGAFDGTEQIDGQYGEQNYWRIINKDDTVKLVVETVMLARARRRVKEGDKVAIVYRGEQASKRGNAVKQFDVYVKNLRK